MFYSDSWEVSSTSKYVTCKCYDILYNLQKLYIYYQMQHNSEILGENYSIEQNKTYYEVFTKVAELINKERTNAGIYGSDIKFIIDERLKNITMPYVLIGQDTAWNILKELANQSLSFVYVDRQGNICVTRDELGTDRIPEENKTLCQTQIDETNAFSYNLPTMSRTIVNRVKVPYLALEDGKEEDNKFEIKENDLIVNEDNTIKVVLELKNFYPNTINIERLDPDTLLPISINSKSINCCYNKIEIFFDESEKNNNSFVFKVKCDSFYKLISQTLQVDSVLSQKRNGIVEYELDSKNIFGRENANKTAMAILEEYSDGKSYIEAEWTGNIEIDLGSLVYSRADKEKELTRYEIVSNELTLENGLRFTTKARLN